MGRKGARKKNGNHATQKWKRCLAGILQWTTNEDKRIRKSNNSDHDNEDTSWSKLGGADQNSKSRDRKINETHRRSNRSRRAQEVKG